MIEVQESFAPRVLRDMSTAVLVLNRKGYIMYVNRPASEMLELNPDLVPGTRHFRFFSENRYNDDFYQYILEAIYHKSDTHIGKVRYQTPSGRKYIFHISSSFLTGSDAGDDRIVIILADETKEELLQEKIHDSATTFSTFLFGFSIWMIIYALWEYLGRPISRDYMTHGIELLALMMLFYIIHRTSLTWRDLGIHVRNPGESIRIALIISACTCVFLCILKVIVRLFIPAAFNPSASFFDFSRFADGKSCISSQLVFRNFWPEVSCRAISGASW